MRGFEIFSEIIINAAIAHGFLIAILLRGDKNKNSHFLLSLLLIDLSLVVFRVHYLMYDFFEVLGRQFFLTGPFLLLLGPFLFFYLRSIVRPETAITKKDAGHFVLFAVYVCLIVSIYFAGKDGEYSHFLQSVVGSPWIFLVLQFGYYLMQTNRLVRLHRKNIVDKFSNVEGMDASWLKVIVWIFAIILIFITIAVPSLIHGIGFATYKTTSAIFYSLILFFIAFKGIRQRVPEEVEVPIESNSIVVDDQTIQLQKEKLLSHIEKNKPFLNPELTLTDLAKQMGISRNQLSQVINVGVGDNFYNFINKFRVDEVKRLIKEDPTRQYKLISLANDAGFNSKSSFNNIFKKTTGLTPSEYRDGHN
ncbi:MAG: helix-turn-helix domain-containing protein [Cyclobacteriaceae bacterium]